jgi:hypothetical protein
MGEDALGARILAKLAPALAWLDPAERAWLEERLLPGWYRRRRRLAARDAAVRKLATCYDVATGRALAAALYRDLSRYAAAGWRFQRSGPPAADPQRALMYEVLALGTGRVPSKTRLREILAGLR